MPHDVIMPALGMAQDTGHLLAWRKSLGDEVRAGDVLMEVETDKAAMEVEADRDGFLAEILAQAGTDVPVGEVIARIAENESAVKVEPGAPAAEEGSSSRGEAGLDGPDREADPRPDRNGDAATEEAAAADAQPAPGLQPVQTQRATPPALTKPAPSPPHAGRVLASPKARMEAHRRGIALEELRRQGLNEPIHSADLDRFAPAAAAPLSAPSRLEAECGSESFDDFTVWAAEETDGGIDSVAIWSAFAAGGLRQAIPEPPEGGIVVCHVGPSGKKTVSLDADLAGLSAFTPSEDDLPPVMTLIDLRGTTASAYAPPFAAAPVIVVTDKADRTLQLALHFSEDRLPLSAALALLDSLAGRVCDPLKHLL